MDIDITKPNPGRIYDYILGGRHNFPADREAADYLVQKFPQLPVWMRLNRWFLFYAVDQLAAGGFACYIDLATGLPTQGYLHDRVPEDARIIYNDIDPVTVAFAQHIIGDRPNIRYVHSDIRDLTPVLDEAGRLFGDERRIGICMVGVSYFLDDQSLATAARRLYDWAASGSWLALSFADTGQGDENEVHKLYDKMGSSIYSRTEAELLKVMAPWQLRGAGMRALDLIAEEEFGMTVPQEHLGRSGVMQGGFLEKR